MYAAFTARRGKQISAIDIIYVQLESLDEISIELSGKRVSNKYFPKHAGSRAISTTRLIIASRCALRLFRIKTITKKERATEKREGESETHFDCIYIAWRRNLTRFMIGSGCWVTWVGCETWANFARINYRPGIRNETSCFLFLRFFFLTKRRDGNEIKVKTERERKGQQLSSPSSSSSLSLLLHVFSRSRFFCLPA